VTTGHATGADVRTIHAKYLPNQVKDVQEFMMAINSAVAGPTWHRSIDLDMLGCAPVHYGRRRAAQHSVADSTP
jgi:hypothetical protein